MELSINQEELKNTIKTALVEVFEEHQDLLHDSRKDKLILVPSPKWALPTTQLKVHDHT